MKKKLAMNIDAINKLSLISYLELSGYIPIATRPGSTDYQSPFDEFQRSVMTVDHSTNRFIDVDNNVQGTLVDYISEMYGIHPEEICKNVVLYRIDILMSKTSTKKAALQ